MKAVTVVARIRTSFSVRLAEGAGRCSGGGGGSASSTDAAARLPGFGFGFGLGLGLEGERRRRGYRAAVGPRPSRASTSRG
eukprot:scaffold25654_cov39-Phaeocystis_antarctica.AAC.3